MIHPLADVKSAQIGEGTNVWQFCVVLEKAVIGSNCNINCHVLIENDVVIGQKHTIKPGVQVWDGLRIGNNVFIGPNVTFTNVLVPRSKVYPNEFIKTIVEDGASIGANSTILAGITIGHHAMIGAGSVVTRNIPAHTVWVGNPARIKGYITESNEIIGPDLKGKDGTMYRLVEGKPIPLKP